MKKTGEHSFWAVSKTSGSDWAPIDVPESVLSRKTQEKGQTTPLAEAIITPVSSKVVAEVIQVCYTTLLLISSSAVFLEMSLMCQKVHLYQKKYRTVWQIT